MLLLDALYSIAILISAIVIATIVWIILKKYLATVASRTKTPLDDVVLNVVRVPLYLSIVLLGVNLALRSLGLFTDYLRYLDISFYMIWTIIAGYILYRVVDGVVPILGRRAELPYAPTEVIRKSTKWIIVIATVVALMAIAGIDMGGVVAVIMLVLGTLVFLAFAAWSIMGNVTAGIVLMVWRPFEAGDYVEMGPDGIKGHVEDVNLMFVKMRMKSGEIMNIPNTLVLQKFIRNYSKARNYMISLEYKTNALSNPDLIKEKLIEAASMTDGILDEPKPTVTIKGMEDTTASFELHAYTNKPAEVEEITSALRLNILKLFSTKS